MTIEELREKVKDLEKNIPPSLIGTGTDKTILQYLARQLYGDVVYILSLQHATMPNIYDIPYLRKQKELEYLEIYDEINVLETKNNLIKWAKENRHKLILSKPYYDWVIWTTDFIINLVDLTIITYKFEIPKEIIDCLVKNEKDNTFGYVTKSSNGFETKFMFVKKVNLTLEDQYNDSLPHSTIIDFINSDSSGLTILHGIPGCGKTTYLRHLISSNPDKDFYILDSNTFNYITDSSFIEYLIDHKNSIFILEDCESLLVSRNSTYNSTLAALLNISDGMLGDGLNLKFICTFNTNLANIDKALLRKGRLKIKYEFDKLDKIKAQNLINKLGKDFTVTEPMALCDIYNIEEDNGVKSKKKIGF